MEKGEERHTGIYIEEKNRNIKIFKIMIRVEILNLERHIKRKGQIGNC